MYNRIQNITNDKGQISIFKGIRDISAWRAAARYSSAQRAQYKAEQNYKKALADLRNNYYKDKANFGLAPLILAADNSSRGLYFGSSSMAYSYSIAEVNPASDAMSKSIEELNKEIFDKKGVLKDEYVKDSAKLDAVIKKYTKEMSDALLEQMRAAIENAMADKALTEKEKTAERERFKNLSNSLHKNDERKSLLELYLNKDEFNKLSKTEQDKLEKDVSSIISSVKVSNAEEALKAVKAEGDYIRAEFEKITNDYGIPFAAIAAISGFRAGQITAFEHIVKATIVEGKNPDIKGYSEMLQTAGGKSLIGTFVLQFLMANPNVDTKGKMITWLTNEDGNSDDLMKHAKFIYGDSLGKILHLKGETIAELQKKPGALRKAFEECSIAIMTYSSWSGLFSSSMASLLAYNEKEVTPEVKARADHNRKVLADAGIQLEYSVKSGVTKVQFKNASDTRAAIKVLIEKG